MGLSFRNQEKARFIYYLDVYPAAQESAVLHGEKSESTVTESSGDREHFGIQRSAISQLSRRFAETLKGNQELRKVLGRIAEEDL